MNECEKNSVVSFHCSIIRIYYLDIHQQLHPSCRSSSGGNALPTRADWPKAYRADGMWRVYSGSHTYRTVVVMIKSTRCAWWRWSAFLHGRYIPDFSTRPDCRALILGKSFIIICTLQSGRRRLYSPSL